jgi:hypothetical protein
MLNGSEFNESICQHCQPLPYQMNGYEMIAKGDWSGLITHYGLSSLIIAVSVFLFLHFSNKVIEDYNRRKRENKR